MVDLRSKRCAHHGCKKIPPYGVEGARKREFGAQHKRAGMVIVQRNSLSSVGTKTSSGRSKGGALAAGGTSPVRRSGSRQTGERPVYFDPADEKRGRQASPLRSRRRAWASDDAAVKTEPEPFSIGRRGGWRR